MTLNVLVVDDEVAENLVSFLQQELGEKRDYFSFETAISGAGAIKKVNQSITDIAILDYNLGEIRDMNGYQTAKALRAIVPNLKMIGFSSSWSQFEAEEVGLELCTLDIELIKKYLSQLVV